MHLISDPRELGRLLNSVDWAGVVTVDADSDPLYELCREIEAFEDALAGALSRPEAPIVADSVDAAVRASLEEFASVLGSLPPDLRESTPAIQVQRHAEQLQRCYADDWPTE